MAKPNDNNVIDGDSIYNKLATKKVAVSVSHYYNSVDSEHELVGDWIQKK